MSSQTSHPLDHPVWTALSEIHQDFCIKFGGSKFYNPEYCPFGDNKSGASSLDVAEYGNICSDFFLFQRHPEIAEGFVLKNQLVCLQMIVDQPIEARISTEIKTLQSEGDKEQLFELVNLVQPGYFRRKTSDLGTYYGIFDEDRLVAASGERMKMNNFTEVSAIVNHPDYLGRGYATQLIAHTCKKIYAEGKIPFLHVAESNTRAIALYEKLGFVTRARISLWHVVRG